MMLPRLKKYDKKYDYSYTFGAYPTIDLLKSRIASVVEVVINPSSENAEGVQNVIELCRQNNVPINFSKTVIEKIAFKENTYVVGVFNKFDSVIEKDKNHIILVNPSNTGNLGTIIRTMVGFNINNLAIITPSVDIFDPKVLRSTMGAFFNLNFEFFISINEYRKSHQNNLYSLMLDGSTELNDVNFKTPFGLIFGNEGAGLDAFYKDISTPVYIKHGKEIDSLNLAVCAGIVLHKIYND